MNYKRFLTLPHGALDQIVVAPTAAPARSAAVAGIENCILEEYPGGDEVAGGDLWLC